jgi:imidazolonepropionase-like amidohydrolase
MATRIDADLLIPGRGDPITNGSVVIEGAGITYAGPSAGAPSVDGEVIEVATVLPGLWECHGHFFGLLRADLEADAKTPTAVKTARATMDVIATLMGGVTSVREVGGVGLYIDRVLEEGRMVGPKIYGAGAILSTTGGHADVHGLPLDWVLRAREDEAFSCLADGVPDCLRAVRRQLRKGAAVIKVCASGGVASELDHPIHQQFSDEELRAIVDEANRAERAVAAHCHGKPGIMAALRAGVRTIEHGSYLDEEAAELMKEKDAVLVPTRFIIAELLEMEEQLPAYVYRKAVAIADQHALAMKIAVSAGVTIAAGTDIIISGDGYGQNGREVRHLVDAGMTPLEAIEAATANGPLTLGAQAPRSGRLAESYDADVIAIDGNPIDDLELWGDPQRVSHVWKSGRLVKSPT